MDNQLNEQTYINSIKVPKNDKSTNKKGYHKNLGNSVINSSMSSPSAQAPKHTIANWFRDVFNDVSKEKPGFLGIGKHPWWW